MKKTNWLLGTSLFLLSGVLVARPAGEGKIMGRESSVVGDVKAQSVDVGGTGGKTNKRAPNSDAKSLSCDVSERHGMPYELSWLELEHDKITKDGLSNAAADDESFYNYMRTPNYLKVKKDLVFLIDEKAYGYAAYWYTSTFEFISSSHQLTRPAQAAYVRFMIWKKNGGKFDCTPSISTNLNEFAYHRSKPLSPFKFTYGVYDTDGFDTNEPYHELKAPIHLLYDRGILMLPPNYSRDGEPVRLAIYCHGSGGMKWNQGSFGMYNHLIKYLGKEGYAVLAINGITNKYYEKYYTRKDDYAKRDTNCYDNLGTPIAMSCYKAAYNYVRKHYNVKREVVAFGKSLGGVMTGNLVYRKEIPCLAVGCFGPVWDVITEIMRNRGGVYKDYYCEQFGMQGVKPRWTAGSSPQERAYFKANASKTIGYNPLYNGCLGLDLAKAIDETYKHRVDGCWDKEYPEERSVYEKSVKIIPTPYKVWIAVDDRNVNPHFCHYVEKMSAQSGSLYKLRWMPKDTGGHWSTDIGSKVRGVFQPPIKAKVRPKYGEEALIPVAYIELVQWWRRFE